MPLGVIYPIEPEPMNLDHTVFVDIGALRVGVERRDIDTESLRAAYADRPELTGELDKALGEEFVSDSGVSLHVIGAEDGHEYLRFDCFETEPHYHYLHRVEEGEPPVNQWVPFDSAACGDMLDWALHCIGTRLPDMLAIANGADLAAQLDQVQVERAMPEIEARAKASEIETEPSTRG